MRQAGIALVGAEHPVDQLRTVAAAAGRDQDVLLGRHIGARRIGSACSGTVRLR